MSIEDEVREFLTTRRARTTPERAGIPSVGQRCVPGLRRKLARASTAPARGPRRSAAPRVRPIIRVLESIQEPSYLRNARLDGGAVNTAGFALYDGHLERDRLPVNLARLLFLDPRAQELFHEWDVVADDAVAVLRAAGEALLDLSGGAGRHRPPSATGAER